MNDSSTIRRRAFLGACSGIGAGLISGCTDGFSADEPALDSDADIEIKADGPALELLESHVNADSITYGDEFTVSIAIANVGNEPIRAGSLASTPAIDIIFTETSNSFSETVQREMASVELGSGETTTITLGPFDAVASGSWRLQASEYIDYVREGAEIDFEIEPWHAMIGEPFPVAQGVSMTVEEFHLLDAYLFEHVQWWTDRTAPVLGMETTADRHLFAIPEITISNETPGAITVDEYPEKQYQLGTSQFAVKPDESEDRHGVPLETSWLPGDFLHDLRIRESETRTVWTRGTVDVDYRGEITFEFRKRTNIGPPEVIVEIAGPAYPQFELVDVIVPDEWATGSQWFGVEVKNIGNIAGTFHGTVQYAEDEEFFDPLNGFELTTTIEPGETAIETVAYDHAPATRYRFMPFGETVVV